MRDIVEIYMHWQAGCSIRSVARSLGLDRNTVRKYVRAALEAGFVPGEIRSEEEWASFIRRAFPAAANPYLRSARFAELRQFTDHIREGLKSNTLATVWQRLRDEAGLGVSLSTPRRYVHARMPEALPHPEVTVWRPEVSPGEEAQIDFGYLGTWAEPFTGKTRRVWAFVIVLAYSRHMFLRVVRRLDLRTWLQSHFLGFQFFRGVPQRLVLDNLKDGVLKPDLYDPKFNRAYDELGRYYRTLIDSCRAGYPKDKGGKSEPVPAG